MIKLKEILNESKFAFDRKFGESLPTLSSVIKKHQDKNEEVKDEPIHEGHPILAKNIDSKAWRTLKYELRDQIDEIIEVGEDYGVFQAPKFVMKTLKQVRKLLGKV